jgi:hypothetical protein
MLCGGKTKTALFLPVLCVLLAGWLIAQDPPTTSTPPAGIQGHNLPASPNELVRQAIDNELRATASHERFQYRGEKQTPNGTTTRQYVETNDGTVARAVAYNHQPLTADQQRKEEERLQKLSRDPEAQQKHRKDAQEEDERVKKMLKAMPDAFIYRYDGEEEGPQGWLVKLRFTANPNFNPPNRETQIYRGMEGTMLIQLAEKRLAVLNANLVRSVSFGWGILGHLDPGGHFIVKQTKIAADRWETTDMTLKFTGRALFFHKINIDEHDTESDFQRVPDNLSLSQGVEWLERKELQVAQKKQ